MATPDDTFQGWEGIKLHAEWLKDDPAQTVLMLQIPKGPGSICSQQNARNVHAERCYRWTDQARARPREPDPRHE